MKPDPQLRLKYYAVRERLRDVCVQVTQALKNTGFLPDVNGEGSSSALTPEPHNNSVPDGPLEVSRHAPPPPPPYCFTVTAEAVLRNRNRNFLP
jgi:hypothetical protein